MGRYLTAVVIGACAVVFLVSLVFLLIEPEAEEKEGSENSATSSETPRAEETAQTDPGTDQLAAGVDEPAATSSAGTSSRAREECVEQFEQKWQTGKYVSGSLLASFEKGLSYGTVIRIVESEGLTVASEERESEFEERGWLEVSVPAGEEPRHLCRLRSRQAVTEVLLNPEFRLR